MIFNHVLKLSKTPPAWLWMLIFISSISGTFYLGLNPDYIGEYWSYLVGYNVVMSLVAIYFISINVSRLKRNSQGGVIGSKFTWSFVKIIPILVIIPVLSFYMFSFQTIQDNVRDSEKTFDAFSTNFISQVSDLYTGVQKVRDERYTEQTKRLLTLITSFGNFKIESPSYKHDMQIFLESLIDKGWACQISLFNQDEDLIAKTQDVTNCKSIDTQVLPGSQPRLINEDAATNVIQVKMSTRYVNKTPDTKFLIIDAIYASDPGLLGFLDQVQEFTRRTENIDFDLNTSITQNRFLIDFSSTVLLSILSALLVVLKMIENLMQPLHNLSLATREIAKGNYDVRIDRDEKNDDVSDLIEKFNDMSKQIKSSREGLDTHNLYLETILKYSYGVIALDQNRNIRLINPIIGKMLEIKDEKQFIGSRCVAISKRYPKLKPLFDLTAARFLSSDSDWSEEIEITLEKKHLLLSCQGAVLEADDKAIGYVIVIKDISQLNRAQKKAAWGEVAVRMAHEIKNPLTPILLSAQRLRNRFLESLKGKDLEVVDKTTTTIIDQVKSMDSMVSAFADYANTPEIEKRKENLNEIIDKSISLYDAQDNVSINFDLDKNAPDLMLDSSSMSRVLINLVKNSYEAAEEKDQVVIDIATKYIKNDSVVKLTITDNGIGFDKEVLDKVFEPYVTTKLKGSGLGMAIVQNIIEQHDGRIFASNVKTGGAMITIEFDYNK